MSSKKAVKSVSLLWLGSLLGSGSTFLIYTIVARKIGPETFGLFSAAIATATIFTFFAGFGVSKVWLKLFGEEGWNGVRWIRPSLVFVLITLVLSTFFLSIISFLDIHDKTTGQLLLLLNFYIFGFVSIELVCAKFQLEENYTQLALWQLLPNVTRLILVLIGFYIFNGGLGVLDIGIIYAIVGFSFTVIAILKLYKLLKGKIQLKGHVKLFNETKAPKLKEVLSESWPFGLASVFAFIYVQSDIIMVKYIIGNSEAGYYNTAFVLLTAILMLPSILFGKFLMPKYHRWANHDTDKFYNSYNKGNKLMLIVGVVIMAFIFFLAKYLVPFIFGKEYLQTIGILKLLSLTLPISFVSYSVGATLVTKKYMKIKVLLMGIVALLNIVLNIILIPSYAAYGAAIATLLSNLVLLFLYVYVARKKVFAQ